MVSLSRLPIRVIAIAITIAAAAGFLTSCASLDHLPETYQGPVATLQQTVRLDREKRNCGFVRAIDDKDYTMSDVSKLKPTVRVEPGKHRLLLRGHVVYLAEIRNFVPTPYAEGWVTVNLSAGKKYEVQTQHEREGTSVWLADAETGLPVSPVIAPVAKR